MRYPNLNDASLYSTSFIPIDGYIDTISVQYPPAGFEEDKDSYNLDAPTAKIGDILALKYIDTDFIQLLKYAYDLLF